MFTFRVSLKRHLPAALLFTACLPGFAASYTSLTVFGDSLSDNGNAYLLTGGSQPGSNYGRYTFSNGLTTQYFTDGSNTSPAAAGAPGLWIDKLASRLGVADPTPYFSTAAGLPAGTNYAVGGAESGSSNAWDVANQVALFSAHHPAGASATGLYAFWAGANDILGSASPVQAADNIQNYITALHAAGARDFVWLNLPLLGEVPRGKRAEAALNAATEAFNAEWTRDLAALQGSGISVTGVDVERLFASISADPAAYGFTNITDAAQGAAVPTDAGYLSWDGLHPTTAAHTLVADAAYRALVPTPEPTSLGFAVIGLLVAGLALFRSRLRRL